MNKPEETLQEHLDHEGWMHELQRRSWELELLVSGFSIFLLAQAPARIEAAAQYLLHISLQGFDPLVVVPATAFITLAYILISSLIGHLLLRGVWIALIGLRSVFPDSEQSRLILRLDQLASLAFSFSFLIVGSVFSFVLFLLIWGMLGGLAESYLRAEHYYMGGALAVPALLLTFSALIWLLNHLTGDRLARSRIFSRPFAKIDFFLKRLTLAFVYQPIYTTLATRTRWSKLALWVCLLLAIVANFKVRTIDEQFRDHFGNAVKPVMYEKHRPAGAYIRRASIDSDVIETNAMRLFLVNRQATLLAARADCKEFEKLMDYRFGYRIFKIPLMSQVLPQKNVDRVVQCLADQFQIFLDGEKLTGLTFFHHKHPKTQQIGMLTYIPLSRGPGQLRMLTIEAKSRQADGTWSFETLNKIPFWHVGS